MTHLEIKALMRKILDEINTLRRMRQFRKADELKHKYKLLKAKLR